MADDVRFFDRGRELMDALRMLDEVAVIRYSDARPSGFVRMPWDGRGGKVLGVLRELIDDAARASRVTWDRARREWLPVQEPRVPATVAGSRPARSR